MRLQRNFVLEADEFGPHPQTFREAVSISPCYETVLGGEFQQQLWAVVHFWLRKVSGILEEIL